MLLSLVLASAGIAFAFLGTPMDITNQGCVDQQGFLNCQNKIKPSKKLYQDDQFCVAREEELACFASHCWNKVYQCNYQQYAIKFLGECRSSNPIPYFPAPSNATDDCSCNLGNVYLAISSTALKGTSCEKEARKQNATDSEDVSRNILKGEHCKCCQISGSYASLDAICPSTNPLHIGFDYIAQMAKRLSLDFDTCEEYILQGSCVTKLNFTESVDGASKPMTYLAASNLTSFTESNTAMVTNNVGTVSSPPGGSIFTWTGELRSWGVGTAWKYSTPTYTVIAATAAPRPADADVTMAENITPAPTVAPAYTLNVNRLKSDGVPDMEVKPKLLALVFTATFVLGFVV